MNFSNKNKYQCLIKTSHTSTAMTETTTADRNVVRLANAGNHTLNKSKTPTTKPVFIKPEANFRKLIHEQKII